MTSFTDINQDRAAQRLSDDIHLPHHFDKVFAGSVSGLEVSSVVTRGLGTGREVRAGHI